MSQTRNTTHEYRCTECGVTMKGRANERGEVRATNAPPSGEQRECVCTSCQTRRMVEELNAERVAAGVCRHCGGPVPCWSPYGDRAVGVRH